ncbi:hypothetical protein [Alkalibacillus haloalkaliphilus]|uniref:Uncharacterized protein n=1 Tax=Alkalibacillus haloalkaliphilus TaxID=94136 RepID=A0A511W9F4_9BACI|nr:hypothetical protein [Alkalibacillus haloalkaliphilus]GEN45962.1 hypothetical protein AHA02nite_17380 [Alkalibacillus haloalkaliphilus]
MNAQQIQQKIEGYHYWDARMVKLRSDYFGYEVKIVFQDTDGEVKIHFLGCSRVCFTTSIEDRLHPLREMNLSQIPYFIQDIDITEYEKCNKSLFNCRVTAPPLDIEIVCNSMLVNKE